MRLTAPVSMHAKVHYTACQVNACGTVEVVDSRDGFRACGAVDVVDSRMRVQCSARVLSGS